MRYLLNCLALLLVVNSELYADSPAHPRDYEQATEGGEYIFVMRAVRSHGQDEIDGKHARSGLYVADKNFDPLWTVDWYAFSVFPSSDGIHLVRLGPWASDMKDLALSFYKNGSEIMRYEIGDLIRNEGMLRRTVSHFFWVDKWDFNDESNILNLITLDDQEFEFDVKTGQINAVNEYDRAFEEASTAIGVLDKTIGIHEASETAASVEYLMDNAQKISDASLDNPEVAKLIDRYVSLVTPNGEDKASAKKSIIGLIKSTN